jgi:hypothetical protein
MRQNADDADSAYPRSVVYSGIEKTVSRKGAKNAKGNQAVIRLSIFILRVTAASGFNRRKFCCINYMKGFRYDRRNTG